MCSPSGPNCDTCEFVCNNNLSKGVMPLRSRDRQTRSRIPRDQLRDYQLASESLRRANFDAAQLVIALAHMHAEAEQCSSLCRKLGATILQMKLWVETCEMMPVGGFDRPHVQVQFRVIPPHDCEGKKELEHEPEGEAIAEVDPAWGREVDALLRTTATGVRCLTGSATLSAKAAGRVLVCLSSLSRVLVRQRLHVAARSSMPPKVNFQYARECPDCGQDLSGCYEGKS